MKYFWTPYQKPTIVNQTIIIGTRGSDLALWQAHHIQGRLEQLGHSCALRIISTKGDNIQHLSFDKIEGKGFFTKELEDALLHKEIDLAVHSHKDLQTTQPDGLVIAAVSERQGAGDLLLINPHKADDREKFHLGKHAVVGSSSSRRKALMHHYRPDVDLKDIRGNVPTRLKKLRSGEFDAILLAEAGIQRLKPDLSDLRVIALPPEEFVPAPAQGVLAIQCRKDDRTLIELLSHVNDPSSERLVYIEREVLRLMDGGCHLPLGVYAQCHDGEFEVHVAYTKAWNTPLRNITFIGDHSEALPIVIERELKK